MFGLVYNLQCTSLKISGCYSLYTVRFAQTVSICAQWSVYTEQCNGRVSYGCNAFAMHSFFWEIPVFNWCCCELALYIFHLAPFLKFGPFGPNGPFGPLGCPSNNLLFSRHHLLRFFMLHVPPCKILESSKFCKMLVCMRGLKNAVPTSVV